VRHMLHFPYEEKGDLEDDKVEMGIKVTKVIQSHKMLL